MSYFRAGTQSGQEVLIPLEQAASGWGAQIRGTAISGALARSAERAAAELDGAAGFRPVRWTVDLFRPAGMAPSTTEAVVVRSGRRLRLVDTAFLQDGRAVAHVRLLLLAIGAAAHGEVWAARRRCNAHSVSARRHRRRHVNLVTSWGTAGVTYINADVTLSLRRLPRPCQWGRCRRRTTHRELRRRRRDHGPLRPLGSARDGTGVDPRQRGARRRPGHRRLLTGQDGFRQRVSNGKSQGPSLVRSDAFRARWAAHVRARYPGLEQLRRSAIWRSAPHPHPPVDSTVAHTPRRRP